MDGLHKNKLIVVKASSKVDEMKKIILSCAVLAYAVAPTFAQEAANEKKEVTKAVAAAVAKNADEMKEVAKVVAPAVEKVEVNQDGSFSGCLLYTSPSPRDRQKYRMPSSA